MRILALASLFLCLIATALLAGTSPQKGGPDEKEPGSKAKGKMYAWQYGEDSPAFYYYLPKDFEEGQPIRLTFVLHGSNLTKGWGFANHRAGEFRANDLVVCPDGTTSNGNGGFNSLQSSDDLKRLHSLHQSLGETFQISETYIYGHSQGSFFSLLYAGAYPEEVNGVVAHASGSWIGTQMGKKYHHQAICHMHGTLDPVVPYSQSIASHEVYLDKDYPTARLRSIQDYNHWPSQAQTEQALAWCQAMATEDPKAAEQALEALQTAAGHGGLATDYGAIFQAAQRIAEWKDMEASAVKSATKLMGEIEDQAQDHVAAIQKSLGKHKPKAINGKPWSTHAALFLREYNGVPACEDFQAGWKKALEAQEKTWSKLAKKYYQTREKDPAEAAETCATLLSECYLNLRLEDDAFTKNLESWIDKADDHGIKKKKVKALEQTLEDWNESRKDGRKSYLKIAKKI